MTTKSLNILYVDDEIDNLVMFNILFKRKFNINTEVSAAKAIEGFQSLDIDLLVTDYKMPGILGTELILKLKTLKPSLKTIILTGYADPEMLMTAINQCHVDYVVHKPFETDYLTSIFEKIEADCLALTSY